MNSRKWMMFGTKIQDWKFDSPQKKTLSSAGFGLKLGVVVVPMHLQHMKYSPLK